MVAHSSNNLDCGFLRFPDLLGQGPGIAAPLAKVL